MLGTEIDKLHRDSHTRPQRRSLFGRRAVQQMLDEVRGRERRPGGDCPGHRSRAPLRAHQRGRADGRDGGDAVIVSLATLMQQDLRSTTCRNVSAAAKSSCCCGRAPLAGAEDRPSASAYPGGDARHGVQLATSPSPRRRATGERMPPASPATVLKEADKAL